KERIDQMAEGIIQVSELKDPVGEVLDTIVRPNGLHIDKVSVPMGVIGIIYESRPNVTADAFALCFKSGNATILRGGSDAINSNRAIVNYIREALENEKLPDDVILIITDTSREVATEFMKLNQYVDLLFPRGGAGLIQSVVENATVPVIETGVGNCHIYVDESADIDMAVNIIDNAKTQRFGVCNAAESLVIHRGIAKEVIPAIYERLSSKNVEMRGADDVREIVRGIASATEEDYAREYLGPYISVKLVDNIDHAIEHINIYSTHHSEAIITEDSENAEKFLNEIDSACVYWNASTRFTDGYEFGFGSEIGISTQKLHARGPMGLKALTSYKYQIKGNGQIRQ
ncbi:MAG: glutamate-5-semialdehyde dehydrogenase, partial [Lachnospiraceae bacterium]|nr:glutamate-5-semialdehyde dehydrogenase [Lachnospiraceae bacterium]